MYDIKALAERFIDMTRKGNETYILMSVRGANDNALVSYPYIAVNLENKKFITVFTSLETAKNYVDKYGYEKISGNYPISKLPNDTSELAEYLFGLLYNRIEMVAIIGDEYTGTYCDILHLIQELDVKLNVGVYNRYINLLPLISRKDAKIM